MNKLFLLRLGKYFLNLFFHGIFFSLLLFQNALAQTGPAGVGNSDGSSGQPENIIWLDANTLGLADGAPILTWPDLSGNGNDLVQLGTDNTPLFETNGLFSGNYAAARFDGTEKYLTLADNADLDNSLGGITIIAVVYNATLDGSPRGIYSKRVSSGSQRSYNSFTYTASRLNFDIDNGANQRLASSTTLNTTTDYISTNRYNGSLQEIYLQSVQSGSASITGSITDSNSDLILGALNENYGTYFDGDIAELIFYREGLNDAERLIVENYLSQKYAITITNDFFGTDAAFNSSFVNDIVGIGTSDGSSKFSDSGFSDAMKVAELSGSLNASNEFVMTAHDNTAHADGVTADITVDPGVLDSRWARSWYVESTGNVSAELTFDFGTAGLPFSGNASDYVILYRPNTSSNYTRLLANSYTVANGDQLVVNLGNISLPTGYYTVGEGQQLVPGNWYSYQTGDWNDPLTWTTVSDGSLRQPVTGGVPTSSDNVTILSGRTVTMDTDDNDGVILKVDGGLDIANTTGHDFFTIEGNGTIYISGDVSTNDNFPTGSDQLFADSIVGGTVIVNGTGINLDQAREYNNLVVDLTNSTDVVTQLADYTINGDFTLTKGIFQINDNSATNALSTTVYGDVQVAASAEINVGSANARHEFNFYGDFLNNGTAEFTNRVATDYNNEATDGIVDANFLNGSKNQTIDCNGVTNFYRIEIDKGTDQTYILDINATSASNFNLFGAANYGHGSIAQLTTNDNALGLLKGTVRLNANVDVPVINNTGNYNISESARLWVNGGSAEKPSGTAFVPYGTIQVSSGILNAPINSGITTRENGNIIVEGGTVTVNQIRTSVLGVENIGGYTQSGGIVNVTGNNISTSYYAFSLTYPGNTFNMSGGELNVSGAPTGTNTGGIFIASDVSNQSVTGGTVTMEINRNDDFKVTSLAPFWNVNMRYTSGTGSQVDLIDGASGTGGNTTNITNPDLRVLNNLTIESGVTFDHNGYDVKIGSNFTIQLGADYLFSSSFPNTTTINGSDNSILAFYNRTGGTSDEQRFWNLIINKPSGKTVSFESGKSNLNGTKNNLLRIDGDAFKVLSGTVDQGFHSIRVYTDTLVNYDELTVYNPANATPASTSNGNNDQVKFRPDNFVLITADTSRFGNVRLNNGNKIVTLNSDLKIDYLEFLNGRMDLQGNNLKIDVLEATPNKDADNGTCTSCYSVSDMFISSGQVSAGGISMYIPANGLNPFDGTNSFLFPFGVGNDRLDATGVNSKYTPATLNVNSATDDGYITIRPVDNVLSTTDPAGGDILSYYWKVDYEGFSTLPTVEYTFKYYDNDLDGSSNEALFVPGKVLDVSPFTRSSEAGANLDDVNNIITFNGGGGGFALETANYTAGESARFVGAPEVYYSRQDGNWNATSTWSTVSHLSATNTGTFPQTGDIAIIGYDGTDFHRVNAVGDVDVAVLEFNSLPTATAKTIDLSRVLFGTNEDLNAAIVRGIGELQFAASNGNGPSNINASSDLGDFVNNKRSSFIYTLGGTGDITIPAISKYPSLRFYAAGANSSANKTERFFIDKDIECSNLLLDGNAALEVTNDIVVTDTLFIGANRDGELIFNNGATATSVETNYLIFGSDLFGAQRADNRNKIFVEAGGGNGIEHRLIVNKDIFIATGSNGTYPDLGADFDLYTNASDNNVILELAGEGSNMFEIEGDDDIGSNGIQFIPEFYRIVVNKGNNKNSGFEFADGFTLSGPTSGTTKALELQNGNLKLNSDNNDITIDLTTGGASFTIPSTSGLQVTDATVNVSGDDSGIVLDGLLTIDGGTVDMDDAGGNGNNFIEYSSSGNAALTISSGTLNVGSQIRPTTSANTGILKYNQSGGDVRIGTQSGPESTRGMLQIYNVGSEFTYTGGTLTIERHQTSPTIAALYLDPDVSDVTGSTITIFNANTPVSQTNFGINSTIPLNNLVINGTNSPTALLTINALEIDGDLTINSGATLDANGLGLSLYGDFVNDGTFTPSNNTTSFVGSGVQTISGIGTNSFYNLTKDNAGSLELNNSITINGLFTNSAGTISDFGNTIDIKGNAILEGDHTSSGGEGLKFSGASNQQLFRSTAGTSDLGMITIANSNGVTIPAGNGYNFNINDGIRLDGGVFDVGSAYISLGINADITAVSPFSVSNMIKTNSSFVDGGISKQFAANYNQDFTFPVGQAYYTPVSFDFGTPGNTFGSTSGTLSIRPANEYHPTINDGSDFFASGDINNVLQYYWTIDASGINGLIANMTLQYDQSQVLSDEPGYDETDYLSARILTNNNPSSDINKFDVADVDEGLNTIVFNFTGESSDGITGDYFAGIDEAIPANVATYTVDTDGNVDDAIYDIAVPGGGAPSGAVVIVPNGFTATLNIDNIRLYKTEIQSGGTLVVDNTTNHRLGTLVGTGTLKLVSDGANANLPAFSGNFLSCSGGGLEYAGTGSYSILGGISTLRKLTLSGSGDRNLPNNNVTICEDLVVDGPTVNNINNKAVSVDNDFILNSGIYNSGTGTNTIYNDFIVNGGTFNGQNSGIVSIRGDLVIQGGTYNSGSGGNLDLYSDLIYTSGLFNPSTGSHQINMLGSSIQNISGNFVMYRFKINSAGINITSGSINISSRLFLTNGIISTNNNLFEIARNALVVPSSGSSNSYINGNLSKVIGPSGSSFTFPIGSSSLWRPVEVNSVSTGELTWDAEYFQASPLTESLVDNLTATNPGTIKTISDGEYWKISDGNVAPSGTTATIGLSWGFESDVSTVPSEREELQVMAWNDGATSWDNYGGTNFSSGHTQSQGSFEATSTISFSENIVTLGSADVSNALPVELIGFDAKVLENTVKLRWVTASELNNDFFTVLRSKDGENFNELATIIGSGTVSNQTEYSFVDERPYNGLSYYKLQQTDFDGTTSEIGFISVRVQNNTANVIVNMYPNPFDNGPVTISVSGLNPEEKTMVKITDTFGREYYSESRIVDSQGYLDLVLSNLSDWGSGVYVIGVYSERGYYQTKMIKR